MPFPWTKSVPVIGYSECERATATPTSPIHVRRLTATGLHTGGGADTAALCGAKVAWDISAVPLDEIVKRDEVNRGETFRYCQGCLEYARVLVEEVRS